LKNAAAGGSLAAMRVKGTTVQQIILGLALVLALAWSLAYAAGNAKEIKGLQLSQGASGTRVEVELSAPVAYRTLTLSGPDRYVIDLPDTALARGLALPAGAGRVRGVRSGQPTPGTTRLVFDLDAAVMPARPRVESRGDGSLRLILEWPATATANRPTAAAPTAPPASATPAPSVPAAAAPPASGAASATSTPAPALIVASTTGASTAPGSGALGSAAPGSARPASAAPASAGAAATATAPRPSSTTGASPDPAAILGGAPVGVPAASASAPPSANTAVSAPVVATPAPLKAPELPKALRTTGTRPLIVAIDAGHGGQDPGAIGPSGKREKDVTLAIARELARQVDATPGLKAVLTRDSDMFLPLTRRTQIARQARADIFISIHADAAENRNARGSSVYVLSLRGASSQRARWLADKENAADLIGGTRMVKNDNTLASVLLDLTQSGQMRASEDAADHVLSGLKRVGYNHKPHLERANFAVLRTSDMPAMLVETAFISNAEEEKRLVDPQFQRTLARAVLDGIDTYFTRQPPPGTLYAARALERAEQEQQARLLASASAAQSASSGGASAATAKAGGSPD